MYLRRQAPGHWLRATALVAALWPAAAAIAQAPADAALSQKAESADGKDPSAAAPPVKPEVPEGWRRERFALKRGKTKLELTGYIQEDLRHYEWQAAGDPTGRKQAKEHELRRLRMGAKAQFNKLLLEFSADPRHLATGSRLKSLAATYTFAKPLSFRIGYFKLPGSKEFNVLTNNTDFADRSMAATRLVPERDWGMSMSGVAGRVDYLAGVFRGDSSSSFRRTGTTFGGRLGVEVVKGLQISGSFMEGKAEAAPPGAAPLPKGGSGVTTTGFTFWNRPYVEGARTRLSSSLSYSRGRFRLLGEYLQEDEERKGQGASGQDLPDVRGRGFNAQAAFLLNGERRGVFAEPRPSVFHGGLGAIELVARVETMDFDDTGDPGAPVASGSRAANLAPAGVTAIEAGFNYVPANFLKIQTTAMWESYSDPRIAPVPGNTGHYFSVLARLQVMIP